MCGAFLCYSENIELSKQKQIISTTFIFPAAVGRQTEEILHGVLDYVSIGSEFSKLFDEDLVRWETS